MVVLSNANDIKTRINRCTCCNNTTIVTHDFNQNNRGVSVVCMYKQISIAKVDSGQANAWPTDVNRQHCCCFQRCRRLVLRHNFSLRPIFRTRLFISAQFFPSQSLSRPPLDTLVWYKNSNEHCDNRLSQWRSVITPYRTFYLI